MAEATNKRKGGRDGDRRNNNKKQKKDKKGVFPTWQTVTHGSINTSSLHRALYQELQACSSPVNEDTSSNVLENSTPSSMRLPPPKSTPTNEQFHQRLWPDEEVPSDEEQGDDADDIEASIQSELSQLKSKSKEKPFYSVKMPQECGIFSLLIPR